MKRIRFSSALLLAVSTALAPCLLGCGSLAAPSSPAAEKHPLLGAPAPSFELPALDSKQTLSLASYAGHVVIVDFWATWCAPCRQSFPAYQRLAQQFAPQLVVIGISVDDEPSGIRAFAKDTGARFALAWDEGQITAKSYQPPTMPTSYLVDRSGIVRFVHSGFSAGDEQQIEAELRTLLK